MKILSEIGLPLDGSKVALRGLGCAVWMASRLEGRVHVLHVGAPIAATNPLRVLGVPEKFLPLVDFHQVSGDPAIEILAAEKRLGVDLIVLSARGESSEAETPDPLKVVGHVAREVIEKSEAPVLLLPLSYQEALPWHSALVPISGETGTDESLAVALRLAQTLDLTVTIAHVAAAKEEFGKQILGVFSDQAHHEYPHMLNEYVARVCPMASTKERERIEDFCLCHGDIAHELLGLIETKRTSLLVVGWHGQFVAGHARVLKTLIQEISCPLLLVKAAPRQPFRLKVGEEM
jgi:nucleotide-binding universal stress UspA family protein